MKKLFLALLVTSSILFALNLHVVNSISELDSLSATKGDFALVKHKSNYIRYAYDGTTFLVVEDKSNSHLSSCKAILDEGLSTGDGVYTIRLEHNTFQVYCDMTTDGGGWTLVWSNLRERTNKYETNMLWDKAINSTPLINGNLNNSLDEFQVYTGLKFWNKIGKKLRYTWANSGTSIDQSFKADFKLLNDNYTLALSNYTQLQGSVVAGIWSYHNNRAFTTVDRDNDVNGNNCATYYSSTPFWYGSCWNGNINGGGENSGNSYYNGAYWASSSRKWGDDDGSGAGNGWIWIQ